PHLLAVPVVGEGLDDVGAGALEIEVQGAQRLRMLEGHLGHEVPGSEVAAALELEQEALRADHGAGVEAVGQDVVGHRRLSVLGEGRSPTAERYGTGAPVSADVAMCEPQLIRQRARPWGRRWLRPPPCDAAASRRRAGATSVTVNSTRVRRRRAGQV